MALYCSSPSRIGLEWCPRQGQLMFHEGTAREPRLNEHLVVERSAVEGRPGLKRAFLRAEADRRSERGARGGVVRRWALASSRSCSFVHACWAISYSAAHALQRPCHDRAGVPGCQ